MDVTMYYLRLKRREFIASTGRWLAGSGVAFRLAEHPKRAFADEPSEPGQGRAGGVKRNRVYGLLIGSAIGDAVGGPVEFKNPDDVARLLPGCRNWPDERRLDDEAIRELAESLPLLSYKELRPQPEPYGQWRADAPPGTVTDDTRHKMVLMGALRAAKRRRIGNAKTPTPNPSPEDGGGGFRTAPNPSPEDGGGGPGAAVPEDGGGGPGAAVPEDGGRGIGIGPDVDALPFTARDIAAAYVGFPNTPAIAERPEYTALCEEGHREFVGAARWVLGEREQGRAFPPERLWGGIPTCCGQMLLLPIAAVYPGQPEAAYRAAYRLGFVDNGPAKDLNSAVVAGLSKALVTNVDPQRPHAAWQEVIDVMSQTDPYGYANMPYVERPTVRWLRFAREAAKRAGGRPKRLYEILERDGDVKFFWEAHFTIVAAFAALYLCEFDPLAAMHILLDFGHDTDSMAQLLGAFAGALYGADLFPAKFRQQVEKRLASDYDHSLSEWTDLLSGLAGRKGPGLAD